MMHEEPDGSVEGGQQGLEVSVEVVEELVVDIPMERRGNSLGWRNTDVGKASL